MRETAEELSALQSLLDRSFERASDHLKSIMEPQRRLAAGPLDSGQPTPADLKIPNAPQHAAPPVAAIPSLALPSSATVTAPGGRGFAAVDGLFFPGHGYSTPAPASPKSRQLRARPATSASSTPRDGYGVFCHGRVAEIPPGDERQMINDHFVETYGQSAEGFGVGIFYARIDAEWLVAFAMTPEEEVAIEKARQEREAAARP